jgi:preprotein translocase subunit SecG
VFTFFVVIHVLICLALVLVVLLQSGRGGGLAGAFGGGGAQTFFGGRGAATLLSKATAWLAVGFMIMSILLAVLSSRGGGQSEGVLQRRARQQAGQVQLPPSTSALDLQTAIDSLDVEAEGAPSLDAPAAADTADAPGDGSGAGSADASPQP